MGVTGFDPVMNDKSAAAVGITGLKKNTKQPLTGKNDPLGIMPTDEMLAQLNVLPAIGGGQPVFA